MRISPAFAVAVASCCALGTWAGISAASAQPTSSGAPPANSAKPGGHKPASNTKLPKEGAEGGADEAPLRGSGPPRPRRSGKGLRAGELHLRHRDAGFDEPGDPSFDALVHAFSQGQDAGRAPAGLAGRSVDRMDGAQGGDHRGGGVGAPVGRAA